jgi:hypothetical protein
MAIDVNSLTEEQKAVYDQMQADFQAQFAELKEKATADLAGVQGQVTQLTNAIGGYEAWAKGLMQVGLIDDQGRPTGATTEATTTSNGHEASRATTTAGNADLYDPRQLRAYFEQKMAERESAWGKYAQDMQKYINDQILRMGAYVTQAASVLAKDPEAPINQIFEAASRTGGDLRKAYDEINKPILERKALQKEVETLKGQVKEYQGKLPATIGQMPGHAMPLRPQKVEKAAPKPTFAATGRYTTALAKAPTEGLIVPDADLPASAG